MAKRHAKGRSGPGRRRSKRWGAVLVLLVVALAPPTVLGMLWGIPDAEKLSLVMSGDQWRGGADEALIAIISTLAWAAWFWVAVSMVVEAVVLRRGKATEDVSGLRRGLRPLLAIVLLKSAIAGSLLTATVGASDAFAQPVSEVSSDVGAEQQPETALALHAYEVVRGDTLWGIAEDHLNDGLRWREIHDLSKDGDQQIRGQITDPNLIFPGDIVLLPGSAAPVAATPSFDKVAQVYGETIAMQVASHAEVGVDAAMSSAIELESLGETFSLQIDSFDAPVELEPDEPEVVEEVVAVAVETVAEPAAEPAVVEAVPTVADGPETVAVESVVEEEVTTAWVDPGAPANDELIDHGISMGDVTKIALSSVSLLTVGGLGLTMVRRRRLAASVRVPGEMMEPLRADAATLESEVLQDVEAAVPWSEWIASAVGDFASRRPAGGARVQLAEGSEEGVELLLSERSDTADWGPWNAVHGRSHTVLSMTRSEMAVRDDVDGWEALPLLVTVGERLILNFERAGVVSVVAVDEAGGLGTEAVHGLCRAIIAEVTCRMAECEVAIWVSQSSAQMLGEVCTAQGVKVLATDAIDEEVSEQWRDASSRRTQAMLDMKLSVDDDRRDGVAVGSCLVVCTAAEADALSETSRLAGEATHNLAMLVIGAAETETRLEVSVPGGEMIVHPWGIRVASCYVNDPTAATINQMVTEPVRMRARVPIGREVPEVLRERQRPLGRPTALSDEANRGARGPQLSRGRQPTRFSGDHAAAERAARQRRSTGVAGASQESESGGTAETADSRVEVINLDAEGGARRQTRAEPAAAFARAGRDDDGDQWAPTIKDDQMDADGAADDGDAGAVAPISTDAAGDGAASRATELSVTEAPAPTTSLTSLVSSEGATETSQTSDNDVEIVTSGSEDEQLTLGGAGDAVGAVEALLDVEGDAEGEAEGDDGAGDAVGAAEALVDVEGEAEGDGGAGDAVGAAEALVDVEGEAEGDGGAGDAVGAVEALVDVEGAAEGDADESTAAPIGTLAALAMSEGPDGNGADEGSGGVATVDSRAERDGDETGDGGESAEVDGVEEEHRRLLETDLSEPMQQMLRRQESLSMRYAGLQPATVARLQKCASGARWAALTVGPLRVARLEADGKGEILEVVDTAAALAALLAMSGTLSAEEAQACLRFGSNERNWRYTLSCLSEVFGQDFVADPAGMRLKHSVADLKFFEEGFEAGDLATGLELLRGEVFDDAGAGSLLWTYEGVVESARPVIADWCSAHAQMLLESGDVSTAERVVKLGLLSEPLDGALLEAEMCCVLEQGGRDAGVARVAEHRKLGADNGDCAERALERALERRGEILHA